MEPLQEGVERILHPTTGTNVGVKEAYGDAGNQGSPLPGETASPSSYFQHSPSLPVSGLTEFSHVDSASWDISPEKAPEQPTVKGWTSVAPHKQYVGVRVRMPVRELLRKIRLSKGIGCSDAKEKSVKPGTKKTSETTEKKRAYSEKRHKQNRHRTQVALKSVEELDILVEVLQEDLNKSQSTQELQFSMPYGQGPSPEDQRPWREGVGYPQPANRWESLQFQAHSSSPTSGPSGHPQVEHCRGFDCRMTQGFPNPSNLFQNSHEEQRCLQRGFRDPRESFLGFAEDNPSRNFGSELLEDHSTTWSDGLVQKPNAGSSLRQEVPAVSFFQFQLHQEEMRLRNISVERLLAPDSQGNRLLHVAVAQGRRALAYALAWRLAHLNKIDEKDAAKQTALHVAAQKNHHLIVGDLSALGANINARDTLGKTPLHLCTEKGYLTVLEVLKNIRQSGSHVEVDATDNEGFTPLQRGVLVYLALAKDWDSHDLSPDVRKGLALHRDQILRTIRCLMEMGADPWVQGTKSSDQASQYFAKVQEDKELMTIFHIYRSRWPEDPNSCQRRDVETLQSLHAEETELPTFSFSGLLDHFLESAI